MDPLKEFIESIERTADILGFEDLEKEDDIAIFAILDLLFLSCSSLATISFISKSNISGTLDNLKHLFNAYYIFKSV